MDKSININSETAKLGHGSHKHNTEDIFPNQLKDVTLNVHQNNSTNVEKRTKETNTCKVVNILSTVEKGGTQSLNENVNMGKEGKNTKKDMKSNLLTKNEKSITKIEPLRTPSFRKNTNKIEDIKQIQEENDEQLIDAIFPDLSKLFETTNEILLSNVKETPVVSLKLKEVEISKNSNSLNTSNITPSTQDFNDQTSKCLKEFEKVYVEVQKKHNFEAEDLPLEGIDNIFNEEYIASAILNDPIVDIDKFFSDDYLDKGNTYFDFQGTKNSTVDTIQSEVALTKTKYKKYPTNTTKDTDVDVISISSDDSCNVDTSLANAVIMTLNSCVIEISDDEFENPLIQGNNIKTEILIKEMCSESFINNLENDNIGDSRHYKYNKTSKETKNIEDNKGIIKTNISENYRKIIDYKEETSAEGKASLEKDESSKGSESFKEVKTKEQTSNPQKLKGIEKPSKKNKGSDKILEITKSPRKVKTTKEHESAKENGSSKQHKRIKDENAKNGNRFKGNKRKVKENSSAIKHKILKGDESVKENESAKNDKIFKGDESAEENETTKGKRFEGNESCNDEGFKDDCTKDDKFKDETAKGSTSINTTFINFEELLETMSLKSNKTESDDGYNSSDFEFITEEEAKNNLLSIDSDLEKSYLSSTQCSNKAKSNCKAENKDGNYYEDEKDTISDVDSVENYKVPQEEDILNIFRNLPPMSVSEIHVMENKSLHTQIPMLVQYEGIGFDMDLMMQDSSDDDDHRDEARKTMEKIFEMNPDENEHISRTIARDRPGCSK